MPYYYSTPNSQTSNASASTNSLQIDFLTIAGLRAAIQKIMGGTFVTPADNATLLRLYNTTVLSTTSGAIVPQPLAAGLGASGAIAAQVTAFTQSTPGTLAA